MGETLAVNRVLVVGPGAMGILFAVRLHQRGREVALLDHRPARAERLNRTGVCLRISGEEIRRSIPVYDAEEAPRGSYDVALFCVKSYSTEAAAQGAARWVGEGTVVVTLQNGLDHPGRLAARFGEERLLVGVTSEGATLVAEGMVHHAGSGKTLVGAMSAEGRFAADRFVALLQDAGFDAARVEDWQSVLWTKATLNAAINPVTAILGVPNGTLAELEPLRRLVAALAQEGGSIARRCGVEVPPDLPERAVALCQMTASNRSSMLQDVERGNETELESINGVLLREAATHRLNAEALFAITELARARVLLARREHPSGGDPH